MKKIIKFFVAVLVCELVGILSMPFTISAISSWYTTLNKPFFSPPNWIFGPVWTLLYFLMGIAAFLIWEKGLKNKKVKIALFFFITQLFFNFLWSVLFFGLKSPILAFVDIVLLMLFILMTYFQFLRISKAAAYILIPYILWVTFASLLNLSIVLLN
ncbi:MAG: TspO/MBR family protein [bacterium]